MALDGYDPAVIRQGRQPYTDKHFAGCRTFAELIPVFDELMATFGESTQRVLLRITLGMLLTPDHIAGFAFRLVNAGLIPRVQDYAQYAAFIARFVPGVSLRHYQRKLRAGEHDVADMQYLF
jgi:hypothetical protein